LFAVPHFPAKPIASAKTLRSLFPTVPCDSVGM
jgi:hypothetical protein